MTVVTIFEEAKNLISDEKKWTQGLYARDVAGIHVSPDSPDAVCWCASGAIFRVGGHNFSTGATAIEMLTNLTKDKSIPYFNDTHTHSEVLAKFDEAIALARKEAL